MEVSYIYGAVPVTSSSASASFDSSEQPTAIAPWKAKRQGEACDKCRVFVPSAVVVLAAVIIFLWLSDELPGIGSPMDPDGGDGIPPEPYNPAYLNHTLGPLVPSMPFQYSLSTAPLVYATTSKTGIFVWTVHPSIETLMLWRFDHLFYTQTLINAMAVITPFSNPVLAYYTQGARFLLVAFSSTGFLTMYRVEGYSGNMTIVNSCYPGGGPITAITDDPASAMIIATDSAHIYFMYISDDDDTDTQRYLNCTGQGTSSVVLQSPALALVVESSSQWIYSVHAHSITAWSFYNTSNHFTVVSGASSLAAQVEVVGADTLVVMDLGIHQLLFYTINSTSGLLTLESYIQVATTALSFAVTPDFAYVLSPLVIQQFNWLYGLPLDPPFISNPFNASSSFMLAFPSSNDAVSLYESGGTAMNQYVIM